MISAQNVTLAKRVDATSDHLIVVTDTGEFRIRWADCSPRLAKASNEERRRFELSPSGYGIHWPLVDEDLTVKGLVAKAMEG